MTEEEGELLHQITNEFWVEFSKLIGRSVSRAPQHLRGELMMQLSDPSSVYGSDYSKYLS